MNRRHFFLLGGSASALWPQARWQNNPTIKAGFAEADVTPEIGMEQPGGYGKVFHRSLHDPCKARAGVFDDGSRRVAVVGLDALMVPRSLVVAVRKQVEAVTGIAGGAVLLNASHSHSSGPVGMVQPGEYDGAPELVRRLAYKHSSCADARYLKLVESQIVKAIVEANGRRTALLCGVGSGIEEKAAFNRRFRMKNGRTYTHPGQGNPDIVKVAGPIDPEVGVIGAWTREGQLAGCIVNYACHATTSPGGISANWIYYLERAIRGMFGPQVIVVFLQGCCGDVTQVDNLNPYQQPNGAEYAQLVGGRVGAEAIKVLLSMKRGALTPVDSRTRVLRIARRKPSPQRLAESLALVQQDPKPAIAAEWIFAKETVLLDALLQREPVADVEVQAIQIGPAVIVANPAEYFVEFGLEIKSKSRFRYTFPAELSNGCVGYVPTEEALSESGGGYETRLTSYSNLIPSAGREIAVAGIELANSLTPGVEPAPPKAKPFASPWSYGDVPAQRN
jgi:hypothetical protein